jgi:hypothetical protein
MPSTSKKAPKQAPKTTPKAAPKKAAKTTPKAAGAATMVASSGSSSSSSSSGSSSSDSSSSKRLSGSTVERTFAMNTRNLSVSAAREVTRVIEEERSSQAKSLQLGIDRLVLDGHISSEDAKELEAIVGEMREPADLPGAALRVGRLYQRMLTSGRASSVALAIAGAFNASLTMSRRSGDVPRMSAKMRTRSFRVFAVVRGMIRGMIGGVVGGTLGAGIGAAIAATASASLGLRDQDVM